MIPKCEWIILYEKLTLFIINVNERNLLFLFNSFEYFEASVILLGEIVYIRIDSSFIFSWG